MGTWLLFTLSAFAADFQDRDKQGHATRAVLLGGSGEGHWNAGGSVGAPWTTATVHYGLRGGWTPLAEIQTASFARWQPAIGVGKRWIDQRWRVTGEGTLGWTPAPRSLSPSSTKRQWSLMSMLGSPISHAHRAAANVLDLIALLQRPRQPWIAP